MDHVSDENKAEALHGDVCDAEEHGEGRGLGVGEDGEAAVEL